MTTTQIVQQGDRQTVQLPPGFEFEASEVAIRREGDAVILEPIKPVQWPEGVFERIRISDPAFQRPNQGHVPGAPPLDQP